MAEVGELLAGRYQLDELLISGPLGRGFRAYDRAVDETVVVFVLAPSVTASGVEQLREQVRLARRLTHRNIARWYDLGEHDDQRFVTVEYIDGVRLREWLASTPAPDMAARVDVAAQLAEGLAAAHEAEIVHGDIAPVHVMIDRRGRAVLGNFGVSSFSAAETLVALETGTEHQTGAVAYFAPEQVLGQATTLATDIYALGLVIYELLLGRPRFSATNPHTLAHARLHDDLGDLRDAGRRDARLSGPLAELLAQMLAREGEQRPSAAIVAHTLRALPEDGAGVRAQQALAILPFRYHGPPDSAYLAAVLSDELVDLLAQTQGLRVLAAGAAARLAASGERDARQLGRELGVDVIVDGTVMLGGNRLRITARLLEVAEGFQLWNERFEGDVADVFELQDKLAKRIVEALRLELGIIAEREQLDATTIDHYLRGRDAHLRWDMFGPEGAITHYRAALERAPTFKPALAHLALASVLAWFQSRLAEHRPEWPNEVEHWVAQAMALAPELAESQLAAGNLAANRDDYQTAALHTCEALRIAPTFALAHEQLGRMLLESGRTAVGVEHLELAVVLDLTRAYCLADIARCHVLDGELDAFRAYAARLQQLAVHHRPALGTLYLRVGAWTGDMDMIRRGLAYLGDDGPRSARLHEFGQLMLGPSPDPDAVAKLVRPLGAGGSARLRTLFEQLLAEQCAHHGQHEHALMHIRAASEHALLDLQWLERCPLFEPLRGHASFGEARGRVLLRCEALWSGLEPG